MLENQIKEQNDQKLKNIGMSDYERRVNANDIKAYEEMNSNVYSKIVGIGHPENSYSAIIKYPSRNINESSAISHNALKPIINEIGCVGSIGSTINFPGNPTTLSHKEGSNLAGIVSKSFNEKNMFKYIPRNNDNDLPTKSGYSFERKRDATPNMHNNISVNENSRPELNLRYY